MFLFTAFFLQAELNHIIILWCTFCWGFRFRWISNYFRQFVPSWDSAYYQLMMTQNIPYSYLSSKWWLMVIATIVTTTIASFYLYFDFTYLTIVVAAIYNIESTLISFLGCLYENAYWFEFWKGAFEIKKHSI
jgi:hypothetical protein